MNTPSNSPLKTHPLSRGEFSKPFNIHEHLIQVKHNILMYWLSSIDRAIEDYLFCINAAENSHHKEHSQGWQKHAAFHYGLMLSDIEHLAKKGYFII